MFIKNNYLTYVTTTIEINYTSQVGCLGEKWGANNMLNGNIPETLIYDTVTGFFCLECFLTCGRVRGSPKTRTFFPNFLRGRGEGEARGEGRRYISVERSGRAVHARPLHDGPRANSPPHARVSTRHHHSCPQSLTLSLSPHPLLPNFFPLVFPPHNSPY